MRSLSIGKHWTLWHGSPITAYLLTFNVVLCPYCTR